MGDEEEVVSPLDQLREQEDLKKGIDLKRQRDEEDRLIKLAEEYYAEEDKKAKKEQPEKKPEVKHN